MPALAWVVVAFAAATIPTPYIIAVVARRRDVIDEMRRQDSPGDAHFLVGQRISAAAAGAAVTIDIVKGFVPALLARASGERPGTLALVGVAAVTGHSFAPFLRRAGGRGLTSAAGVSLVIVPKAMVCSGVIALVGTISKRGGFGTSVGFALLPVFAVVFLYPAALVAMTVGIVGLIAVRRLEGIEDDRRAGVPAGRAVLARLLFDQPRGRGSVHPGDDPAHEAEAGEAPA